MFTVSELTGLLRTSIEEQFSDIWLEGELSNLRAPGSGHVYCTLKDKTSQIRAVMFRSSVVRLRFALQEGMQVIVRGRLTVYEPRGEYQIVLDTVEPKGVGALQLGFKQLKERLAEEGLFDQDRKKPLPAFPRTVGVVTSLTGAAIRDILAVLRRRWPTIHILIAPVQVQGENAGRQITEALAALNEWGSVDVIIVGRGGGSMEDLWSFNEEIVVRAIAASHVPVVSAVGHEIDVTLSDFVADFRAPTPSAAAEAVVPVLAEIVERVRELTIRVEQMMLRHCMFERQRLDAGIRGVTDVRFRLQAAAQRTDDMVDRLREMLQRLLTAGRERVHEAQRDLSGLNPILAIKQGLATVPQFSQRLEGQMRAVLTHHRHRVHALLAQLHTLSPLAVLGRGYSILQTVPAGKILHRANDVEAGQELEAQLASGRLSCKVTRVFDDSAV
ncbi:MAG: exodeoxyribonuclease VII large subunit [Nitrospirota bacterium]|nr:exodeoxyribonuclease VII large subunit [Nitrospirota bacterium]MDP3596604.1 exodeoxyribonuclease VII large subunit [Nitrospirota bacterium]